MPVALFRGQLASRPELIARDGELGVLGRGVVGLGDHHVCVFRSPVALEPDAVGLEILVSTPIRGADATDGAGASTSTDG